MKNIRSQILAIAAILMIFAWAITPSHGFSGSDIVRVSTLPTSCNPAKSPIYYKTSATVGLYYCSATDTVTQISTGSGNFAGNDGTAAAPSYSFTNDSDTGLFSAAANTIGFSTGGTDQWDLSSTSFAPKADNSESLGTASLAASNIFTRIATVNGPNGGSLALKTATTTVNGSAASTISASNLIPAGSLVVGVSARITSTFSNTSLTSMNIGDGTTADLFGATVALTSGTTTTYADHKSTFTPKIYASATSVVMTGVGADFAANGTIRLVVYYYSITGPTS